MADSLSSWLVEYLIKNGEQYGTNLSGIPLHAKRKKVQITEFLTFVSDNQDAFVWARLSDKKHSIPARFSKETVAEYQRYHGRRITQDKGAIVHILNFKPMVMRIPMAGGTVTLTPSLALDCQSVSLLGSSGEAVFGNPIPITSDRDVRDWYEGLLQDGGAGNILKERKMQRQGIAVGPKLLPPMPTPPTPGPSAPRVEVITSKVAHLPSKRTKVTDLASYGVRWQIVERNPGLRAPPEEAEILDEEIDKDVKEGSIGQPTPSSSRSASPVTNWEQSPTKYGSPTNAHPTSSVSLPAPTPAQRTRATVALPVTPEITSSYLLGNETVLGSEGHGGASQLSEDMERARTVPRKVPRPVSPDSEHGEHSGPARVLVPNSDTSQSQSQSQAVPQTSFEEPAKARRLVLGGLALDETEEYPWMSLRDVRMIIAATAEIRCLAKG